MKFVKPMLAKKLTDDILKKINLNEFVFEYKLDGHRRFVSKDFSWSRSGKVYQHSLIQKDIPEGVLLDGEIVVPSYSRSCDVSHWIKEYPDELIFVAFDILYEGGKSLMDLSWSIRRVRLERLFDRRFSDYYSVKLAQYYEVENIDDVNYLLRCAHLDDLEGIVAKRKKSKYKPNSRSDWMKMKFEETVDVVITDCDSKPTEWRVRPDGIGVDGLRYPEGIRTEPFLKGYVGLSYGYYDKSTGELVRVGSLGWTGPREELQQHVGKVAEVKVNGVFEKTGALQHAVFLRWRDPSDKTPEDCVFDFQKE